MEFIIQYIFNVKLAQSEWNFRKSTASVVFEIFI